jgi:hypothetical protein
LVIDCVKKKKLSSIDWNPKFDKFIINFDNNELDIVSGSFCFKFNSILIVIILYIHLFPFNWSNDVFFKIKQFRF